MTVKPEIKSMFSVDEDIETWQPDEPAFVLALDLEIGEAGVDGSDLFHLYVTSPAWFDEILAAGEVVDGRHRLITKTFDLAAVRAWLDQILAWSEGKDWDECATRLSRHLAWEFEDLQA